jgi:hypothetical protein
VLEVLALKPDKNAIRALRVKEEEIRLFLFDDKMIN